VTARFLSDLAHLFLLEALETEDDTESNRLWDIYSALHARSERAERRGGKEK
jgi:hypothetical protein